MKTDNKKKNNYSVPELTRIELDNEISLVLQSALTPPLGPGESEAIGLEYMGEEVFN